MCFNTPVFSKFNPFESSLDMKIKIVAKANPKYFR